MVATDKHIVVSDIVTVLVYVVPNEWITSEWWMETGVEGSTLGLTWGPNPIFLLEGLRKTVKPTVTTAFLQAGIWTLNLPTVLQDLCLLDHNLHWFGYSV